MIPRFAMIAARSVSGVIGNQGKIPWRHPEDMQHFRKITTGHPVIMGRKTFESIGRPLPNRVNIIVSRMLDFAAPSGCTIASSIPRAFARAKRLSSVMPIVIGGAEIYRACLPVASVLYLTEVLEDVEGDTFFPEIIEAAWDEVSKERSPTDDRLVFRELHRKGMA